MPRRIQPTAQIHDILGKSYFFSGFEDDVLCELALGTRLLAFETGEMLFLEGETCPGLFILHTGSVKLFKIAPNGREFILRILTDGASFNEVPVFDGEFNPVNACALEPTQVWIVEKEVIHHVLAEKPLLYQAIVQRLAQNLRRMVHMLENLAFFQVTQRLARLLVQEADNQAWLKQVKQDELAARLGTVREVVSRSLRELERSGVIQVRRRQIVIVDLARLREFS